MVICHSMTAEINCYVQFALTCGGDAKALDTRAHALSHLHPSHLLEFTLTNQWRIQDFPEGGANCQIEYTNLFCWPKTA